MNKSGSRAFRVYVGIALFLIVLLLATLVGLIVYGGVKVRDESQTFNNKVNSFNQNVNTVNQNLQSIDSQLQKQTSLTTKGLSGL